MDRKKFGAVLVALATGVILSAGSALAQSGYLMGDPSTGKLIPFYRVAPTLATIIGYTNTSGESSGPNAGNDVQVHVTIFNKRSGEVAAFDVCLSPSDFGYLILQEPAPTAAQLAELEDRFEKARIYSVANDSITAEGYVTMAIRAAFESRNGNCSGPIEDSIVYPPDVDVLIDHTNQEHLATWAILADTGNGFFATEIPTPTAVVNPINGLARGGIGAYGLIPGPPLNEDGTVNPPTLESHGSTVIARFDVNPAVNSQTEIFIWLQRNAFSVEGDPGSGGNRSPNVTAYLDCEDEFRASFNLLLPDEVNVFDPNTAAGIGQCKAQNQYRGNLLFDMPDTGFLWSQITQARASFRQNYLGYNLGDNDFIDCADGFNDFFNNPENSAPPLLCPSDDGAGAEAASRAAAR